MTDRVLTTVLFTDIVDSTARASELGDRRWRELLAVHDGRVRSMLRRYGGREVKTTGDGFLAVFDSPARGIVCAATIRDTLAELGLTVRSGLHMGAVDHTRGDVGGMAVHVGSRVASQAGGGEILVSGAVRDAEVGSGFGFEDRGVHALKGVPGEWRLYRVTSLPEDVGAARVGWRERARRYAVPALAVVVVAMAGVWAVTALEGPELTPEEILAADAAPGIAVLPFRVSGTGVDELREGMVDLLSLNLDGAAGLRSIDSGTVLARWEEEVEPGGHPDIAGQLEIARRTGARYAMVGHAIGMGSSLRLSADVYDARSGKRLGRAEAAGHPDSLPFLVDRLTVEALRAAFQGEGSHLRTNLAEITTTSMPALKAFLEGEAHFRRSEWAAAIEDYDRAIRADSTFAMALRRFNESIQWSQPPSYESELRAMRLMERYSGRLPPREALLYRGLSAAFRQDPSMIRPLQEAVREHPEDAELWFMLGENYGALAAPLHLTFEEIARPFEKAVALDPGFTPGYYPLILDALFFRPERARAQELIAGFTRNAPQSSATRVLPLVFDYVFGRDAERRAALSAIDRLDLDLVWELTSWFYWSTEYDVELRLLDRLDSHPEFAVRTPTFRALALVGAGRSHALLDLTEQPPFNPVRRLPFEYLAHAAGMPVPESRLEEDAAAAVSASIPHLSNFPRGAIAADQGRWLDHRDAVAQLRRHAEVFYSGELLQVGDRVILSGQPDSSGGRFLENAARALEGYGLTRRGKVAEGLAVMREAVPRLTGFSHLNRGAARYANSLVQLWVGRLLIESGEPEEALPYLRALRYDSELVLWAPGRYEMGRAFEMLGRRDSAAAAYEEFAHIWKDADPEVQPRVHAARQAAIRLRNLQRE